MKTTLNNSTSKATARMIVMVALLLSSVGMFGQNVKSTAAAVTIENTVAAGDDTVAATATATTAAESANTTLNMVSWFMGTKQTPNTNGSTEVSAKKQLINSGAAPNRLLIKAFLKKASNYNSTVA